MNLFKRLLKGEARLEDRRRNSVERERRQRAIEEERRKRIQMLRPDLGPFGFW
jgi:hypothetical protein